MLTMDQGRITYLETPLPWPLRGFIAILGISTGLGIPAAWLVNVRPETSLPVLALVAVVVVVCVAFGVFLIFLTLISATELQIDPATDTVTRIRRGPLVNDTTTLPRHSIGPPVVSMRDSDDGPFPILHLPLPGRKRFEMACFDSKAEAEHWRDAIAAALRS